MIRNLLTLIIVACIATGLALVTSDLPGFGDRTAPVHNETNSQYVLGATTDTGAVNSVTAIVFDYRAYDTLGEATVLFVAATAAAAALAAGRDAGLGIAEHTGREGEHADHG